MMKFFLGLVIVGFSTIASAADINNGKKWSEMTDSEKAASMERLKAYGRVMEAKVLREGGYKNIREYNRVWNRSRKPTEIWFEQSTT